MSAQIKGAAWIGVSWHGTIIKIEVVGKNSISHYTPQKASYLIAKKKAIVKQLLVTEGKSIVAINQVVKKGERLVEGAVTDLNQPSRQSNFGAKGKVFGEVWYGVS